MTAYRTFAQEKNDMIAAVEYILGETQDLEELEDIWDLLSVIYNRNEKRLEAEYRN